MKLYTANQITELLRSILKKQRTRAVVLKEIYLAEIRSSLEVHASTLEFLTNDFTNVCNNKEKYNQDDIKLLQNQLKDFRSPLSNARALFKKYMKNHNYFTSGKIYKFNRKFVTEEVFNSLVKQEKEYQKLFLS